MKSKITTIILSTIIIFLITLSSFFGYEYFKNEKIIEQLDNQQKVSDKNENSTLNNSAPETYEKIVEKGVIAKYDYNKIIVKNPNRAYDIGYRAYSTQGKLVIEDNYATYNDNIRYTLDSKIVDGLLSNIIFGGGVTPRICLVTEKGDVYIANYLSDKEDDILKLEDVSNICRVYAFGGGFNETIMAVDIDGNCYDLAEVYMNQLKPDNLQ